MKLIKQTAELWTQSYDELGIYKAVERAARLCYRSNDKVTEDSYKKFIEMISSKGHNSPMEHGTVYLTVPYNIPDDLCVKGYSNNPYSIVRISDDCKTAYITTNYRVLIENGWLEDLQYLCEPTEHHERRISVHITTSIGISRELNRHRCHSICEESSRYCCYAKDKFDNCITYVIPNWANIEEGEYTNMLEIIRKTPIDGYELGVPKYLETLLDAEITYLTLINKGKTAQQAREILPLSTKTELIHTAFESDWRRFFKLRCSTAAHPMMRELANQIKGLIESNQG